MRQEVDSRDLVILREEDVGARWSRERVTTDEERVALVLSSDQSQSDQ